MQTIARLPANDMPSASSIAVFSLQLHCERIALARLLGLLDILRDFGGRRAGIREHAGDPGVDRRLGYRLVTQPEMNLIGHVKYSVR